MRGIVNERSSAESAENASERMTPEKELWLAVILQAIDDVLWPNPMCEESREVIQHKARMVSI